MNVCWDGVATACLKVKCWTTTASTDSSLLGGDYRLACDPAFEASVYRSAREYAGTYDSVRALAIPVHILRAKTPPQTTQDGYYFSDMAKTGGRIQKWL